MRNSTFQLFNSSTFSCSEETHVNASLHIAEYTFLSPAPSPPPYHRSGETMRLSRL